MVGLFMLVGLDSLPQRCERNRPNKQTSTATSADVVPLGRYIPKENLIFYVENEGLSAHAASWEKTAAYKMLNETPLGVMLEEVCGQLLDKAMTFLPNRRLSGSEIVSLVKGAARSGWVFALHCESQGARRIPRDGGSARGGEQGVEADLQQADGLVDGSRVRSTSRTKKEGRTIVVVSTDRRRGRRRRPGWRLGVVGRKRRPGREFSLAGRRRRSHRGARWQDGVVPSIIPSSKNSRSSRELFSRSVWRLATRPTAPLSQTALAELLRGLKAEQGVDQIDMRWGFDDDALMSISRLVAPRPRKPSLALFDQPTFTKDGLLPMPDSVESFVELSISPGTLIESLEHMGPPGVVKAQVDELASKIKSAGQIDLQKDVLGQLGPRMVAYLAPGRSATTNDDSLEAALKGGINTTAVVTAMQSLFPKLTLVAEVKNPAAFGKALDTVVVRDQCGAQGAERSKKRRPTRRRPTRPRPAARAVSQAAERPGAGGERTKRRRETSYPKFTMIAGDAKSFVLMTPSDSPLRFGPSSFRPTILLEDKYVAFGVSSDSVRAAMTAVRRKDWKPSASLEKACRTCSAQPGRAECHRRERESVVDAVQLAGHAPDHDQHVDRTGQGACGGYRLASGRQRGRYGPARGAWRIGGSRRRHAADEDGPIGGPAGLWTPRDRRLRLGTRGRGRKPGQRCGDRRTWSYSRSTRPSFPVPPISGAICFRRPCR